MLFLQEESGSTAIEYALIASLVSVALLTTIYTLGDAILATYNSINTSMDAA